MARRSTLTCASDRRSATALLIKSSGYTDLSVRPSPRFDNVQIARIREPDLAHAHLGGDGWRGSRSYGWTGLTYCTVVGCSEPERSHIQKEAGRGEGYHLRCAR